MIRFPFMTAVAAPHLWCERDFLVTKYSTHQTCNTYPCTDLAVTNCNEVRRARSPGPSRRTPVTDPERLLSTVFPSTIVRCTVRKLHDTMSRPLTLGERALVSGTVQPRVLAVTVHLAVDPLALV